MSQELPSGTVTFLFTDVEGSTGLWADDSAAMSASLRVHDDILRTEIEQRGGYIFTTAGDAFCAAFGRATDGIDAAATIQDRLHSATWPGPALAVRLGLHLGEAEERNGDYFGPVVNLAARVEAAGHGGQTLVTDVVRQAAALDARPLGTFTLRGVGDPVAIFQVGDGEFPPLRVADAASTNLPSAPTALIGRADDVRAVRTALRSSRLVTVVAGGGTGKTRLSLAVGDEELPGRPTGVWFVDLTAVAEPKDLAPAIASVLGVELGGGDPVEQILGFVADKNLLLILDNCEHLVDDCAEFAEAFLSRPGAARILATTRERLDIDGEQAVQLRPLPVTDAESSAVRLFVERAMAVNSGFTLDGDEIETVIELCQRLDGLPLAIELAAARCGLLTPAELLAGIDDRFRLLHGGRRRQRRRTLESTLDWSYHLLDGDEQRALRSLGVFVGTFDLGAAAAVLDVDRHDAVDLVDSLVAKSLVDRASVDGVSRFRLLETTAAYAQQALAAHDETAAVRDRHLAHFHRLSEPLADVSLFWGYGASFDRFGRDRANVLAALDWASVQERPQVASTVLRGALGALLDDDRGAMRLIDETVAALDDPEDAGVLTLQESRLVVATLSSDFPQVAETNRWLAASADASARFVGNVWTSFLFVSVDVKASRRYLDIAEAARAEIAPGPVADRSELFWDTMGCSVLIFEGEIEAALAMAERTLRLAEGVPPAECQAQSVRSGVCCHLLLGRPHEALALATRSAPTRSNFGTLDYHVALAQVAVGDIEGAKPLLQRLAHRSASGRTRLEAGTMLLVLAELARAEGDLDTARRLLLTTLGRRTVELYAYARHVAAELGIAEEFAQLPMAIEFEGQVADQRASIEVVQAEIRRRNWDADGSGRSV
ncbi:MAG: adenylate/guanylate cyclase domain-containing protein [Ilumatobacteraceae bacterium]